MAEKTVKRSEHYTECEGLVRPEGVDEAQPFDGEMVLGYRSRAECERLLSKRFGAPVIVNGCKRKKHTYVMPMDQFKREAEVTITDEE